MNKKIIDEITNRLKERIAVYIYKNKPVYVLETLGTNTIKIKSKNRNHLFSCALIEDLIDLKQEIKKQGYEMNCYFSCNEITIYCID